MIFASKKSYKKMKENKIRTLIKNDKATTSTRLWSPWGFFTEFVGSTGNFDYIEFVGEYCPFDQDDLENVARAAELHDMATMMKVDFQNRGYVAQKAIAAGFQAIMFADHHTPEEVKETIRMMKADGPDHAGRFGFPGRRFIGTQPYISQTEHIKRINDIVLAFMIEKKEAVDNIEAICSIPGVDMIQFGPSDYNMSLGRNYADNVADTKAVERHCIEVALKHGIHPRCEILKPKDMQYYIDLGVKDFSMGDQMKKLKELWIDDGKVMRDIANKLMK